MLKFAAAVATIVVLTSQPALADTYRGLVPGKTILTPAMTNQFGQVKAPAADVDLITFFLKDPACKGGVLRVEAEKSNKKVFGVYVSPKKETWAVELIEKYQNERIGAGQYFDGRPYYVIKRLHIAIIMAPHGPGLVEEIIHYSPTWHTFDDAREMKGRDLYNELSDV